MFNEFNLIYKPYELRSKKNSNSTRLLNELKTLGFTELGCVSRARILCSSLIVEEEKESVEEKKIVNYKVI